MCQNNLPTCEGCIHNAICIHRVNTPNITKCPDYKSAALFVQMPEKVYQTDGVRVYEYDVEGVIVDCGPFAFDAQAIGQSVFFTRSGAERRLEEMSGDQQEGEDALDKFMGLKGSVSNT